MGWNHQPANAFIKQRLKMSKKDVEAHRKFRLGMSQQLGCPMQSIIVLQDKLYIPKIIGKTVVHGGTHWDGILDV